MIAKKMENPAWRYIKAALDRASSVARNHGYVWRGESCSVVNSIALWCVMWNRNLMGTDGALWRVDQLPPITNDPDDINLAYADHYLDRRYNCSAGMTTSFAVAEWAYYAVGKKVIISAKNMRNSPPLIFDIYNFTGRTAARFADWYEYKQRENKCKAMSPPGPLERSWSFSGITDGTNDWFHNEFSGIDRHPRWYDGVRDLSRIILPPECR